MSDYQRLADWLRTNFPVAGTPAGVSRSYGTRSRHARVYDPPPVVEPSLEPERG